MAQIGLILTILVDTAMEYNMDKSKSSLTTIFRAPSLLNLRRCRVSTPPGVCCTREPVMHTRSLVVAAPTCPGSSASPVDTCPASQAPRDPEAQQNKTNTDEAQKLKIKLNSIIHRFHAKTESPATARRV